MVKGKKRLQTRVLHKTSQLKTLTRSIGRQNYCSIARQAMMVPRIHQKVLGILAKDIQKELTKICAKKNQSILRSSSPECLRSFTWDALLAELDTYAPNLKAVLRGAVHVKRRIRPLIGRKKPAKSHRPSEEAILCVCAAIILKHKNIHMNLMQRIVSLIITQWSCFKAGNFSHAL